ncbi:HIV Tat-specific factor 1 homolog [Hyalella azteca]|uniref:HIV Tat-specific factor 1 homolog n=1 Tax=Hyalella azteca TaxID=294128 RepID=A0A8B7N004_HYAAZ|nr:HIV Tat-specific factor 1 homolog [Hyalella azteca]
MENLEEFSNVGDDSSTNSEKVPDPKLKMNENENGTSVGCQLTTNNLGNPSDGNHEYEEIDGIYYYTNPTTHEKFKYDNTIEKWVLVQDCKSSGQEDTTPTSETTDVTSESDVHVDEEGRTFYHADGHYLCRYPTGHVYYMNEKQEWVLWSENADGGYNDGLTSSKNNNDNRWYYYKGDNAYYRDLLSNKVFKFNKETDEWILAKSGKKRKKKPDISVPVGGEEEFDTESSNEGTDDGCESEDNDEYSKGDMPPGYKTDPSISFEDENFVKKDKDGMHYEWDKNRRAWFPKLDDTFMATYQMSYGFNPDGSKNENPVKYDDDEEDDMQEIAKETLKKKKEEEKKKSDKKPAGWFEADDAHNTKVYVSQLPTDMTEQQFVDLMQKCGLVLKDPETGDYKVKLYKDEKGNFKGDALCTYIKVESVLLALQIIDGSCLGPRGAHRVKVERAKFQMKGDYNAALKPKKKKKKLIEKLQKKQEKLFAWTPEPLRGQRGKHENVVVLRNAFAPSEFVDHAEKILSHTESLRAQCTSFGSVKKLELFDRHPEGVVKVTFSEVEAADLCIASMNKRLYNGRTLSVAVWNGVENFKVEETEEEKAERLKKWNEFLMTGGEGGKNSAKTGEKNNYITNSSTIKDIHSPSEPEETSISSEEGTLLLHEEGEGSLPPLESKEKSCRTLEEKDSTDPATKMEDSQSPE